MTTRYKYIGVLVCGLAAFAGAQAQPAAAPANVLSLAASASADVPRDVLTIVMTTSREGSDAALVQTQLREALDAALSAAKKMARAGELDVRTGSFSLYPHAATKTAPAGWQGNAELIIEGRDEAAIAQLAGNLPTLTVGRIGSSLSREARQKAEAELTAQAVTQWKNKAAVLAREFGFAAYSIREVTVSGNAPIGVDYALTLNRMEVRSSPMAVAAPIPVETGLQAVTIGVNGTVQMR